MSTRCTLGPQFAPAFHRPFLRYIEGEQGGGDNGGESKPEDRGYPLNTKPDDMSADERAAYYQYHSRKHENRVKAFGDWTPEKIRQLEQENTTLRTNGQSAADKAIEDAREEGRNEIRSGWNRDKATNALERALQGRVPDATALLGLDVSRFIVNGQVDTDAVKAWVDDHSEEAGNPEPKRKNPDNGQGRRGSGDAGAAKSVAAGRDLYAERHNKKSTTTS